MWLPCAMTARGVTIADGTPVGVAAGVARVLEVGEVMGEEPDALAVGDAAGAVSYTHLTLPTKRIV